MRDKKVSFLINFQIVFILTLSSILFAESPKTSTAEIQRPATTNKPQPKNNEKWPSFSSMMQSIMRTGINKAEGKTKKTAKSIERIGERIVYDIRLGRLRVGQSVFNFVSKSYVNGVLLNYMFFETHVPQFTDTEAIYSDPDTFLPVRIERKISKLLARENIVEEYNQKAFTLTITRKKTSGDKQEILQKSRSIQNAILLPHQIRTVPDLHVGQTFAYGLPNYDLLVKLVSIEDVETPAGTFKAYHFESDPKKIEFWIKADDSRIPVKIQGSGAFGYSMVMKEYHP